MDQKISLEDVGVLIEQSSAGKSYSPKQASIQTFNEVKQKKTEDYAPEENKSPEEIKSQHSPNVPFKGSLDLRDRRGLPCDKMSNLKVSSFAQQ